MRPFPYSLQGYRIDVVGEEAAVGSMRVSCALIYHAAEHGLETLKVAVVVLPHPLQGDADAHLSAGNRDGCVDEIEVWKLPVNTIVDDVKLAESVVQGIVYDDSALQGTTFQG